ncbi:hypothetical protein JVU11DRAFT_107 [Chiua virens]|nr:hypothetical protein JVU11DRAFT_107 [Chiua virens]
MDRRLPPELWICIFHFATHVPDTLIPEIYTHASLIGSIYSRSSNAALRDALVTKRAVVRVCRQWWHLAAPILYQSVYIGRARCLSSLSSTLVQSAAAKGTVVGERPLGEYTQRLDIAMRDHAVNANAEFDSLATLISCMPHLAIVSFSVTPSYAVSLPNHILDALRSSAASLRVLDWSSTNLEPTASRIVDLLAKCTHLRILNCPRLVWSKDLQHGGIPLTVTTLRVHALIPVHLATAYHELLPNFDARAASRPGPSALQELILDLHRDPEYWRELLSVYTSQLVSVQFYLPTLSSVDMDSHLRLLTHTCPHLRRLTITSDRFSSFIRPDLVFPSIAYLGLRATRAQSPKADFVTLFGFLNEVASSGRIPTLRAVQLLHDNNVQCLLKTHTKFAVRALRPFVDPDKVPFRVEDGQGVLLTGWCIEHVTIDRDLH